MDLLKNMFKGDKIVWMIFLLLCLISVVEVFSATSKLTYKSGNYWMPFTEHTKNLLMGAITMIGVHKINYKRFKRFGPVIYLGSILLLFILLVSGILTDGKNHVNGAARWYTIAGFSFQPSEFAKMSVVMVVATLLSLMNGTDESNRITFWRILIVAGIALVVIAPENMSTAMLLGVTVYAMMFLGGIALRRLLKLGGLAMAAVAMLVAVVMFVPSATLQKVPGTHRVVTWKGRLQDFKGSDDGKEKHHDFKNNGQTGHACIAIMSSHGIGKGPGNSSQRDHLDLAFSDFIFAIIVEELGIAGASIVIGLYLWLLVRAGKIAKKCTHAYPAYLTLGIAILIVSQAMINMMVAVGLFPVTGQPLPLISKGGTSIVVTCAYLGMILSVSRNNEEREEERRMALANGQPLDAVQEMDHEIDDDENDRMDIGNEGQTI